MRELDRKPSKRMEVLDAFRAIAIIAVAAYHLIFLGTLEFAGPHDFIPLWTRICSYGFLGVEFFFMISGFVIFMTLSRCVTTSEFFIRRFARLYPAYIVSVPLVFVLTYAFSYRHYERSLYDLAISPLLDAPHLGGTFISSVYWSLVTEVRFYIFVAIIHRLSGRRFVAIWSGFCLVSYAGGLFSDSFADLFCAPYLPFFTFGIAFYEWSRGNARQRAAALFAVSLVGVALFWSQPTHDTNPFIVLGILATLCLLFLFFVQGRLEPFAARPLLFIGRISYSLYLVHFEIAIALIYWLRTLHVPALMAAISAYLAVFALACALTFIVEDKAKRAILALYARRHQATIAGREIRLKTSHANRSASSSI